MHEQKRKYSTVVKNTRNVRGNSPNRRNMTPSTNWYPLNEIKLSKVVKKTVNIKGILL